MSATRTHTPASSIEFNVRMRAHEKKLIDEYARKHGLSRSHATRTLVLRALGLDAPAPLKAGRPRKHGPEETIAA